MILIDPSYMNKAIEYLFDNNLDYVDHKMLPSGTETEVFNYMFKSKGQYVLTI